MKNQLDFILEQLSQGKITTSEAKEQLKFYEDFGFVKVDVHREKRKGFAEVIYGEGKTSEQILEIFQALMKKGTRILATRVSAEKAEMITNKLPNVSYNEKARTLTWVKENVPVIQFDGYVAVICAGTSDLPIAEEASETLRVMGIEAKQITDVGVAGIHRLFDQLPVIQEATVSIVIAGMEGALPSVVGGLISKPIIAVPTSVGYGTNFGGVSALLSMLNSCSTGISVVNIDNGFGAAYNAAVIHRLVHQSIKSTE